MRLEGSGRIYAAGDCTIVRRQTGRDFHIPNILWVSRPFFPFTFFQPIPSF